MSHMQTLIANIWHTTLARQRFFSFGKHIDRHYAVSSKANERYAVAPSFQGTLHLRALVLLACCAARMQTTRTRSRGNNRHTEEKESVYAQKKRNAIHDDRPRRRRRRDNITSSYEHLRASCACILHFKFIAPNGPY